MCVTYMLHILYIIHKVCIYFLYITYHMHENVGYKAPYISYLQNITRIYATRKLYTLPIYLLYIFHVY